MKEFHGTRKSTTKVCFKTVEYKATIKKRKSQNDAKNTQENGIITLEKNYSVALVMKDKKNIRQALKQKTSREEPGSKNHKRDYHGFRSWYRKNY